MKRSFCISIFLLMLFASLLQSCGETKTTIILSKSSSNYVEWISNEATIVLDAYNISNTDSILALANGIILTGGEDINPLMYGDSLNLEVCETINYRRDTLEKKLMDYALANKIPLIGVCRGMQMLNVANGGSLYGDIPSQLGAEVIHRDQGEVMHEILLAENCPLIFPLNQDTFMVNSWHHQGLKEVADILTVVARSYDGLPEAVIVDKKVHPYMLAVQFHPERLGTEHPIHKRMRESFYDAMKK